MWWAATVSWLAMRKAHCSLYGGRDSSMVKALEQTLSSPFSEILFPKGILLYDWDVGRTLPVSSLLVCSVGFSLKTATSTLTCIFSSLLCPVGFSLARPQDHVSQVLKISLRVFLYKLDRSVSLENSHWCRVRKLHSSCGVGGGTDLNKPILTLVLPLTAEGSSPRQDSWPFELLVLP